MGPALLLLLLCEAGRKAAWMGGGDGGDTPQIPRFKENGGTPVLELPEVPIEPHRPELLLPLKVARFERLQHKAVVEAACPARRVGMSDVLHCCCAAACML